MYACQFLTFVLSAAKMRAEEHMTRAAKFIALACLGYFWYTLIAQTVAAYSKARVIVPMELIIASDDVLNGGWVR